MTNKEFAEKDKEFKRACDYVHVNPTKRQASKYRNKKGTAYKHGRK